MLSLSTSCSPQITAALWARSSKRCSQRKRRRRKTKKPSKILRLKLCKLTFVGIHTKRTLTRKSHSFGNPEVQLTFVPIHFTSQNKLMLNLVNYNSWLVGTPAALLPEKPFEKICFIIFNILIHYYLLPRRASAPPSGRTGGQAADRMP